MADQQLLALLGQHARVARLLPIPGIGITIATTIVAEVRDVSRFETPDLRRTVDCGEAAPQAD